MSKKKTIILVLLTMALWGSLFSVVKMGFDAYNVKTTADILLFAGVRFSISGGAIALFAYFKDKESFKIAKSNIVPILLVGLFAIILHYACTYTGLQSTDSSKTAILKQIGPLFYVCFSFLFFKDDKLTIGKFIGVLLGFGGIFAINSSSKGFKLEIGDIFIISASLCTIFSNVIGKKVFSKVKPLTVTGISQFFGGVVLLIAGILMGGKMNVSFSPSALILLYILVASSISYCLWYTIVSKSELSKLFIIKFAEPAFACVFATVLLGENILKPQYLIAFMSIALGIYISNVKSGCK